MGRILDIRGPALCGKTLMKLDKQKKSGPWTRSRRESGDLAEVGASHIPVPPLTGNRWLCAKVLAACATDESLVPLVALSLCLANSTTRQGWVGGAGEM